MLVCLFWVGITLSSQNNLFYKIKIHNLNRDLPNIEMHYWEYPDKNRYDLSIWTILKQHCIKQPKWSLKPKLNFKTLHHCMNQMYINSYSFVKWFRQEQWVIFCLLLFDLLLMTQTAAGICIRRWDEMHRSNILTRIRFIYFPQLFMFTKAITDCLYVNTHQDRHFCVYFSIYVYFAC